MYQDALQAVPLVSVSLISPSHAGLSRDRLRSVLGKTQLPGEFVVSGDRYSVVNKLMQPGESYQGEPGVMMYMSDQIKMQARWAGWRAFSGEGLAKLRFTNEGGDVGYLGLTPNMPMAIIVPFDVTTMGSVNCKRGAFVAGNETVKVYPKVLPAASMTACCCGGMPPVIQQVRSEQSPVPVARATLRLTRQPGCARSVAALPPSAPV